MIDADTDTPLELAEWDGGHIVLVRALEGNAFVQIGLHSDFDPASRGRLMLQGETECFFMWAGNLMVKEFGR
ncbi:hypothetical protein ACFX5Q_25785 [Mesorhizobium sp. IMUNJ 23033]|uniref:hypothetical protein n=1 Tax=Mesorhizobium sp. IMUNJ 23033 TaxID=3378039 RepID=UPI00384D4029